jgi:L-glyceraldehyde 3-phosphate reductase
MLALDQAVRQGKALYAAISNYGPDATREALAILRELRTPVALHQPKYSMLVRAPEEGLFDVLREAGVGCIVYSPLAQGLLTDRYLDGVPPDSRAARGDSTIPGGHLSDATLGHVRRLNEIAAARGQKLAQLALQWALRDPRMTSLVIGASSVEQLDANLDALGGPELTTDELAAIDQDATDSGINLWAGSSAE